MAAIIICESVHHKNTEKVALAMAEVLGARVVKPGAIPPKEVVKHSLIGFGSGIYMAKHHKALLALVDRLPAVHRKAFIFSTCGLPLMNGVWHRALRKKLDKKGFEIVGEFSCPGFDTVGPFAAVGGVNKRHPNEEDLAKAREFARGLKRFAAP
jgi:flavodoxin